MTDNPAVRDVIVDVWSEVLGTDVRDDDDFFLLGGHSMLATQMIARVERRLGVKVGLREVLDNPVLAEFVEVVRGRAASASTAD